jgi:hypothetical protein
VPAFFRNPRDLFGKQEKKIHFFFHTCLLYRLKIITDAGPQPEAFLHNGAGFDPELQSLQFFKY